MHCHGSKTWSGVFGKNTESVEVEGGGSDGTLSGVQAKAGLKKIPPLVTSQVTSATRHPSPDSPGVPWQARAKGLVGLQGEKGGAAERSGRGQGPS